MSQNRKLTIVMYHYVRKSLGSNLPRLKALDTDAFKNQLEFFRKNFNFVTMEQVIDAQHEGGGLPPHSLLLTFDDGYVDHYTSVFPLLMKNKTQGTFFVPSAPALDNKMLDVNKIQFILASIEDIQPLFDELNKKISEIYSDNSNQIWRSYFEENKRSGNRFDDEQTVYVKKMLQSKLPLDIRSELINSLFKKYVSNDESSYSHDLYMNIDQMKEMKAGGMHIGGHGHSHFWLNSLSKQEQVYEVKNSAKLLELINVDPHYYTFCYPYGGYNQETLQVVEEAGFKLGFTTRVATADLDIDPRLMLPRYDTNDFLSV